MMYIATFYSHFGAIRFRKECLKKGYDAKLMPVPRKLSSSCGTCVSYEADLLEPYVVTEELEQIVCKESEEYEVVFRAKNS